MAAQYHFLVRLTYAPRILVYTLTASVLGTLAARENAPTWLAGLAAWSLVYPHLLHHLSGRCLASREAILRLQYVDAYHVGLYCAAVHFSPLPALSFLTALLLSNLLLAGYREGCLSLAYLLSGALCGGALTEFRFTREADLATTVLSGASILLYTGLVAHLGFRQMQLLLSGHERISDSNRRLAQMTSNLRRYIAPQRYSALVAQGEVKTTRKRLVVFFSDIEGFTELTDIMEAEALAELLNRYLGEMAEIALRFGGTIDKFMGDGIMIIFGDPYTNGAVEDALACTRMALAMRARMCALRCEWAAEGITRPLHVRVGIHVGFCTVGHFGCEARVDYTAIGGAVNLASRLESIAARDEILVSAETHALIRHRIACGSRRSVAVRGISRPCDLYSVEGERLASPAENQVIGL